MYSMYSSETKVFHKDLLHSQYYTLASKKMQVGVGELTCFIIFINRNVLPNIFQSDIFHEREGITVSL